MNLNFDMDGTIADLYGVENWLQYLENNDATPYLIAKPLCNMSRLARLLNKAVRLGYEVNIISWGSKGGGEEYLEEVRAAKLKWIEKHLPSVNFSNIIVVAYGTPKSSCGSGILFDDEARNRNEWGEGAFSEKDIFSFLSSL